MTTGKILAAAATLSLLTGCGSYYGSEELPPSRIAALPPAELDARIADAYSPLPALPKPPVLMAVVNYALSDGERLLHEVEAPEEHWTTLLRSSGMARISHEMYHPYDEPLEETLARAATGPAEVVLVVNEQTEYRNENTPLAVLYPTLVGMLVAPGSYYTRTVVIDATLWNPRTAQPYFSVTASASEWYLRPLAWMNEYELAEAARRKARRNLAKQLIERLGEG